MDPFARYDQWLEAPYQDMYKQYDEYVNFCEQYNLDPDHEQSEIEYENYLDSGDPDDFDPLDDDYEDEDWWDTDEADWLIADE